MVPVSRYRHPGDAIRLIGSAVLLVAALVALAVAPDRLLGPDATVITWLGPDTSAGNLLVGLVQLVFVVVGVAILFTLLRWRRFRLLGSVAGAALLAGLLVWAIERVVDVTPPSELTTNLSHDAWFGDARFPSPAVLAGAVAVVIVITRWQSAAWRRATGFALVLIALARLVTGTVLPFSLVLAFAVGATVATGLLVAFGAPDRRPGPADVVAALRARGFPATSAELAAVNGKGSRPFVVSDGSGARFFVKILGQDQRDADLLYRAYRFVRLRNVGDVRPAASLKQAVEHQALVGMMAERNGVHVPRVHRVVEDADGSVMLVTDFVEGPSLADLSGDLVTDQVLERLWSEVDCLHRAGIAHRSLRTANVMVDRDDQPWLVDFSFSELGAADRQVELDVAELLASLASQIGPERSVDSAVSRIGVDGVAPAVPLLQPLALSASTRRAVARGDKLLPRTRAVAATATDRAPDELAPIRRIRAKTLLMIAVAAGAFYFLLPQLAQVSDSWRAFQSADWAWVPLVLLFSFLTYAASAIGMLGSVPQPLPFIPNLNVQFASSFVNRVSPANVGGMAANVRFLQKCGVDSPTAVGSVGLNSLVGAVVHIALLVVFFVWSRSDLGKSFKLPSSSKLLLALAVIAAVVGGVLATRWGRRRVARPLWKGTRSSASNLLTVARSPVKLGMLFGGSAGVTLAYVGALAASISAFGGGVPIAKVGAVYLAASALAAAAPTPGGLGAIEAALVAGLTGVGMESGAAVSAVLTYRLATYWIPIAPGWLAWWYLQRKEYL
jgi:glycosyltransferase 2 family protein